MRRAASALAIVALVAAATAPAAEAQETETDDHPRSGFWLSGGLGGGLDDAGEGGVAAHLRLGGTPSPRWLLGADLVGYARDAAGSLSDDATLSRANATFSVLHYLSVDGNLYLKGGVGFASVELEQPIPGATVTTREEGVGATLGAGYDLRLGGNLYLTPTFDVLVQGFDGLDTVEGVYLLSLGIGFH